MPKAVVDTLMSKDRRYCYHMYKNIYVKWLLTKNYFPEEKLSNKGNNSDLLDAAVINRPLLDNL